MSPIQAVFVDELRQIYSVANTPSYLYKHMRRSTAVHEMAREAANDLCRRISEVAAAEQRTLADVAVAYGALVALTTHDYAEWRPLIEAIDGLDRLEWGRRLVDIGRARAMPATSIDVPYRPRVTLG